MKPRLAVAFFAGLLFAIGLGLSGMTQPQKVIGFLDLARWDPSLLFVMAGALAVHAPAYRWARRMETPLLDRRWHVPVRDDVSWTLILGSAIFGIGWGIGGYCPGPALTSLPSGDLRPVAFVAAMLAARLAAKNVRSPQGMVVSGR